MKTENGSVVNSGLALQASASSSGSPATKSSEGDRCRFFHEFSGSSPFWDPCDQYEVFSFFFKHLKLPTKKTHRKTKNLLLEFSYHYPSQNSVTLPFTHLCFWLSFPLLDYSSFSVELP